MKTCVVSAPLNVDLSTLRSALRGRGYQVVFPFELSVGLDIQSAFQSAIEKADLCIFVLSTKGDNSTVIFELGYARGLQKSVLIIQEPFKAEPSYLQGLATIASDLKDEAALSRALDQAIERIKPSLRKKAAARTVKQSQVHPRGREIESLLSQLRSEASEINGHRLEELLLRAFRQAGMQVSAENPTPDKGYDAAIWIDDLQERIKNPILIEVKKTLTIEAAKEIRGQFYKGFSATVAGALLVVYLAGSEDQISQLNSVAPLIFFFQAEKLLESLKTHSLAETLWQQRNRLAHGV